MKQKQEGRLSAALKKTNNYYNKFRRSRPFVNKEIVREGLRRDIEAVCRHLFPDGKRIGDTYRVGNIAGEPGSSLSVVLTGPKAGAWCDFATNDRGDLFTLWMASKGLPFHEALMDAANWLRIPAQRGGNINTPRLATKTLSASFSEAREPLSCPHLSAVDLFGGRD